MPPTPSDFRRRLDEALSRGRRAEGERVRGEIDRALTAEETRTLHAELAEKARLHLDRVTEEFRRALRGFSKTPLFEAKGKGYRLDRDDLLAGPAGKLDRFYSRFEVLVGAYREMPILKLVIKATIRNREKPTREPYIRLPGEPLEKLLHEAEEALLDYTKGFAVEDE